MIRFLYLNNCSTGVRIIISATLFATGLLTGILLQKYYPIGRLLRATGTLGWAVPGHLPMPIAHERIEVPISILPSERVMVALIFGQSNSANFGATRRTARERVYNFHRGKLYLAQDPLLGAEGNGGSVWTRLGDRIIREDLYGAVVFVPLGVGATPLGRWKSDGDLHPRIIAAIDELRAKRLTITHLLWHQGEQDAYLKTSKEEYKRMFLDMLSSIRRQRVYAPIYVSVATRCETERDNQEIQQAQRGLVNRSKGIYPGPNTDLLGLDYRYDGCHFSDEGLEYAASLWLHSLNPSLPHASTE